DKVARANKARSIAGRPAMKPVADFTINWSICSYPTAPWAKRLFPDLGEQEALGRLAEAIFSASRCVGADPIADWKAHSDALGARRDWLNDHRFSALKYSGPGTDLTIGLADGHEWAGGAATAQNGVTCICNIPTEEVFTAPHAMRVDGVVRSTKPLSYQGTLIENIEARFEAGRIVSLSASRGGEVFNKVLDTDEGARRLGEVALVPHSSPISQTGLLFFNTLFDENAASHIAIGQSYRKTFAGGGELGDDQVKAQGGNSSLIHIDWMIGSGEIEIDGVTRDGGTVPVMRRGEWA
ncbi:MAG TPA: aminopeptidase, partial [Devosiaceae bacterium]|nr:aminopeptidase [Devosiaceae bacterium]